MSLGKPKEINLLAGSGSRTNLVNNGDFTGYNAGLKLVQNTGFSLDAHPQLIDERQYRAVPYSFSTPSEAGTPYLGYWDIYGAAGSVDVAPDGREAYDGGNYAVFSFLEGGSITIEQDLAAPLSIADAVITASIGGISGEGAVGVNLELMKRGASPFVAGTTSTITGEWESVAATYVASTSFGAHRRVHVSATMPAAQAYRLRITLVGHAGASVGLSGITVAHGGPGRYVKSVADTALPSNTVILHEGPSCPPGFLEVASGRNVLLTTGHPMRSGGDYTADGGSDTHTHSIDGAPVSSGPANTTTASVKLFSEVSKHPGEKPVKVLSAAHEHELDTEMTSIPPSFGLLVCRKL